MKVTLTVEIDNASFAAIADSLIAYLQSKGMVIGVVGQCNFNPLPPSPSFILLEDGSNLLLEDSSKFVI